jgi:hypothetical protein
MRLSPGDSARDPDRNAAALFETACAPSACDDRTRVAGLHVTNDAGFDVEDSVEEGEELPGSLDQRKLAIQPACHFDRARHLVTAKTTTDALEDAPLLIERGEHVAKRDRLKRRRRTVARNVEHVHPDPPLVEAKDVEHVATEALAGLVAPFEVHPVNLRRHLWKQRRLNGGGSGESRLEPRVGDAKFSQLLGEPLFELQDSLGDSNLREQLVRIDGFFQECVGA